MARGQRPCATLGSRGARLPERWFQGGERFGQGCRGGTPSGAGVPKRGKAASWPEVSEREGSDAGRSNEGARPLLGRGARGWKPLPSRAGQRAGPPSRDREAHYRAWLAVFRIALFSFTANRPSEREISQVIKDQKREAGQLPPDPAQSSDMGFIPQQPTNPEHTCVVSLKIFRARYLTRVGYFPSRAATDSRRQFDRPDRGRRVCDQLRN